MQTLINFLNCWVDQKTFKELVKNCLTSQEEADIFIRFQRKTTTALATQSRERLGDIFKKKIIREENVRLKEDLFE